MCTYMCVCVCNMCNLLDTSFAPLYILLALLFTPTVARASSCVHIEPNSSWPLLHCGYFVLSQHFSAAYMKLLSHTDVCADMEA